jgi:carboxypeptidase PM20D1
MNRGVKIAGGLILAGVAVIAFNTMTFKPAGVADASGITLTQVPTFDLNAASAHLGAAVRFQTVSHQDVTENHPEEWAKLQAWLANTYPRFHAIATRETVGERGLLYRWEGSDTAAKPIILMAHQDVVPVMPGTENDWTHAPFGGEIAEGSVWGRGSIDDKGSLVGLMESLETLAASGFKPKRTIYLVSGHDEEFGGSGAAAAAKILAERGVKALFAIDEGSAIIEDAPMINAPAILIGVAEKGYTTLKVDAPSAGGHSSMPPVEMGTVNLAKAVVAINQNQFPATLQGPVAGMVEVLADRKGGMMKVAVANRWLFGGMITRQMMAKPSSAAMLHTTIAPTMLSGSPKENVLPQTASAMINYRIAPGDTPDDVMRRAQEAVGDLPVKLSFGRTHSGSSSVSSTSSEGWKLIRAAAEVDAPGAAVAPFLVVAGTDSRSMGGVADDVYRFQPLRVKSTETKMIHGTNEHMTLDNLARMIRFYQRLIATAAG